MEAVSKEWIGLAVFVGLPSLWQGPADKREGLSLAHTSEGSQSEVGGLCEFG